MWGDIQICISVALIEVGAYSKKDFWYKNWRKALSSQYTLPRISREKGEVQ